VKHPTASYEASNDKILIMDNCIVYVLVLGSYPLENCKMKKLQVRSSLYL